MAAELSARALWSPSDWAIGDLLAPASPTVTAARHAALGCEYLLAHCDDCGTARLIPCPVCPSCGSRRATSRAAAGTATLHAWARYHRAYLPQFEALVPYVVGSVELDEGPRLTARLSGVTEPVTGMRLRMAFEHWSDGHAVPVFVAEEGA